MIRQKVLASTIVVLFLHIASLSAQAGMPVTDIGAYAAIQTAATDIIAQAVAEDKEDDFENLEQWRQWIKHFEQGVQTAQNTLSAATAATMAVESLAEGDWQGFLDFVAYSADTVGYFGDTLESLNAFYPEDGEPFSAEFLNSVNATEAYTQSASIVLETSTMMYENMVARMERSQEIAETSQVTQSVVGQLQLAQQQLGLMQSTLNDANILLSEIKTLTTNYYNMREIALEQQRSKIQESLESLTEEEMERYAIFQKVYEEEELARFTTSYYAPGSPGMGNARYEPEGGEE
jgi:hypothetical protein